MQSMLFMELVYAEFTFTELVHAEYTVH